MAWISWEKPCKPKSEGGMGFKDLKAFNLTLLAKQGWCIQQNPSSITHKILQAKYFARSTFMEANGSKTLICVEKSIGCKGDY